MAIERASGLLLHVTSLPGRYGCGTMGREAGRFRRLPGRQRPVLLAGPAPGAGVLPLAFFPLFVAVGLRRQRTADRARKRCTPRAGLSAAELRECEDGAEQAISATWTAAAAQKAALLAKAAASIFRAAADAADASAFERFCAEQEHWLDDYALFRALADHFHTFQWTAWPADIARRQPAAVARWRNELQAADPLRQFEQFVFFEQWRALKKYANRRGVRIIGDIPFYVNFESADAWSHPEIFQLDKRPAACRHAVAGVPPDYFSSTGQRWGNPLYRWREGGELHAPTMAWWTARIRHLLRLVDVLRIDHFRGFDTYWAIPASEPTAVNGQWRPGPGAAFFDRLNKELGDLPLIAEDLGELTPGVEALRDRLGFPGMKILQFAFDGQRGNPYLPHNFSQRQLPGLHRHPRQQHQQRLVLRPETSEADEAGHPGLHEPRPPRRIPLAVHPPGHAIGRPPGHFPGPGRSGLRRALPHEHPGPGRAATGAGA